MDDYLTAKEAAEMLGISVATLYAYVSRGMLQSEPTEGKSRARRYRRGEVVALLARQELRRNPTRAAETALSFGTPVLASALTLIDNGRLFYRGYDVVALAQKRPFAEVAALLWLGDWATTSLFAHEPPPAVRVQMAQLVPVLAELPPLTRFQMMLPLAAAADLAAYATAPLAVAQTGVRILRLMVGLVGEADNNQPIPAQLGQIWGVEQAAYLLNMALVLCADHELNVSSFTARCVASAGSDPYAVVGAGLAALQGGKHGGHTERVAALLREVAVPERAAETVRGRLRRGESLPGFGHPLYAEGDPRGKVLLTAVAAAFPHSPAIALAQALMAAVRQAVGQEPNIDVGLVVLAEALGLPPTAPLTLFAIGRTAGWLGHAIEQYQLDQLIRPRASYVGPLPVGNG
ncbi:MAG: citrate synthase family protein [Anaerolineales bacterium]|nr:citrate synthase family protein [Anaerolineales bacterium]